MNLSDLAFGAVDGKIRFGLGAIKGVGEGAIEAILEARKAGPFKSLFDFCERVDSRRVNRKVVEALVKAGAFDFEKRPRRQLFETIESALERGASTPAGPRGRASRSCSACSADAGARARPPRLTNEYAQVEEWTGEGAAGVREGGDRLLRLRPPAPPVREGAAALRAALRPPCSARGATRRSPSRASSPALRERPTKTGKRMAWVTLEDLSGSVELVCFPGKDGGALGDGQGRQVEQGRRPSPGYEHWEPLLK